MRQEVVLAMLAKEPSQGCQLRARLDVALGPLGEGINDGQIYVTLGRLEKAGLVARQGAWGSSDRADRKVYELTPAGQERVSEWLTPAGHEQATEWSTPTGQDRATEWLTDVNWPKPDLAEFHLKLIAAAQAGLADPVTVIDAQRRALLRRLRDAQRAAMDEPDNSDPALLLEGIVLRLQADLRWLDACERAWTVRRRER